MLKDSKNKKILKEDGFLIVRSLISKDIIKTLKDFYLKSLKEAKFDLYRDKGINHVNTAMSTNKKYKRDVFNLVKREIQPIINEVFENYKIVIANYIIKYPGGENECKIHQDISLIEEDEETSSYTLWFTLDDINDKSSPLYAIPKTHNILKNYVRGVGVTLGLNNYKNNLIPNAITLVPFNAGDVLIMNPRVVHGSLPTPNNFNTRIAIGIGIIPQNKNFVLFVKENENIKKYFINEETILNYNPEKKYTFKEKFELVNSSTINYNNFKEILEKFNGT